MGRQLQAVRLRRQVLVAKISGQREQLHETVENLRPAFLFADRAVQAGRFLRTHPVVAVGLAGLLVVRRSGWSALVKGSWRVWKAYRYFNDFSQKLTSKP